MKKGIFNIIILGLISGLLTACSSQNVLMTEPAATLPAQPSIQPTPTKTPVELQKPIIKLPKGILISTNDGIGLSYINLQGNPSPS